MAREKIRYPLEPARELAEMVAEQFEPFCDRVTIVGSIRRERPMVSDIEILVEPYAFDVGQASLIGDSQVRQVFPLYERIDEMLQLDEAIRVRGGNGTRYKALELLLDGEVWIPFDLFICRPPAQFGVLCMQRTGPWEFSRLIVTQRSKGGLLPNELRCRQGHFEDARSERVIPTPNERAVFDVLERPEIAPVDRDAFAEKWQHGIRE